MNVVKNCPAQHHDVKRTVFLTAFRNSCQAVSTKESISPWRLFLLIFYVVAARTDTVFLRDVPA